VNIRATVLAIALGLVIQTHAQTNSPDAFDQARRLGRGVNVLGFDPIWRFRDQARFHEKHFRLLKEAGFSSIRVNLYSFRKMNATNNFALHDSWFEVLDWTLKHAQTQGLVVILDLHEFNVLGENPAANKDKFLAFWRQISTRYANAPASVYFEPLNEPCKDLTPALWNEYFREVLGIIREKNPTRTVIVGPGHWNSLHRLGELKLPEADRNLIVTFHYYDPSEFTHQGASWTGQQDKLGIDWAATPEELGRIKRDFDKVAAWAKEHDRPIYLGEFGAYDKAAMPARLRYLSSVARAAEERGWSWGYWQFDSDFILYDVKRDAWVEPILHTLIPPSATK
jgi:endoglucanase